MRSKGISNETAADLYKTFYNIGNQYDDQTEAAVEWASQLQKAVEKGVITQKQANALKEKMKYYYQVPAEANSYNKIIDAGIDSDTADDLMWLLDGVEGTGAYSTETGKKAVRPIDNIEAVSNSSIGTDEEMETIIRTLYLNDSQEQKLDAVLNLGYNLEEYAAFYRAELDNSKKADFIAAVIGLGYTAKEAENLYYVFNPKKAG